MPRQTNTARYVVSGHLPDGEEFSWGFWMDGAPGSAGLATAAAQAVADDFAGSAQGALVAMLSATAGYDRVTCYSYPLATGPATYVGESAAIGQTGTSAGGDLPLQTARVITLRTAFAGRRARGRMYLPAIKLNLTDHQFVSTELNSTMDVLKAFFDSVNADGDIPGGLVVASQVVGQAFPVTVISVDSRPDIQRRRSESAAADIETQRTLA